MFNCENPEPTNKCEFISDGYFDLSLGDWEITNGQIKENVIRPTRDFSLGIGERYVEIEGNSGSIKQTFTCPVGTSLHLSFQWSTCWWDASVIIGGNVVKTTSGCFYEVGESVSIDLGNAICTGGPIDFVINGTTVDGDPLQISSISLGKFFNTFRK